MIDQKATKSVVTGLTGLTVVGGGMVAAAPATAGEVAPKRRVTFMCQIPSSGTMAFADGKTFQAGDYILRVREEATVPEAYTAGVADCGLFAGN